MPRPNSKQPIKTERELELEEDLRLTRIERDDARDMVLEHEHTITDLREQLQANAKMLARQCDLSREAETNRDINNQHVRRQSELLRKISITLSGHEGGDPLLIAERTKSYLDDLEQFSRQFILSWMHAVDLWKGNRPT